MSLADLTANLTRDLNNFMPELLLCSTIVMLLLLRLFPGMHRAHMGWVALFGCVLALLTSAGQWIDNQNSVDMFSGLLVNDNLTIFLRLFLFGFTTLTIWLTFLTRIPDREDSADFYCLLLGATLGMSLMASSNHLLMVFISVEMASLPSYALAGFLKGRRQSSEAALKYVVYGGGASGIMLYGISLIAGKFGTGYLPGVAAGYAAVGGLDPFLLLGTLFLLIGIGFKLAAVPFHFWCPDVFEGAAAEVAGFLSVASKGAALALLGRVVLVLAGFGPGAESYGPGNPAWDALAPYLIPGLAFFAALTATFGNLAAYAQTNLKRLLAYSTIAHAGYMMMGLAVLSKDGLSAVLFYLIAYLFMNLGAFAVVAFLRNQTGSEDLHDFRGLVYRCPVMVITLGLFLLSLLGLPPLAGFAAKFQIFQVLYKTGQAYAERHPGLSATLYALLVIGGLNTVLSLVYYIKVLKVMVLDKPIEEVEGRAAPPLPMPAGSVVYAEVMAVLIVLLGIFWNPLAEFSSAGSKRLYQSSAPVVHTLAAAGGPREGRP
jgi:NADH-quinone oxidoreductase subunit N